MKIFLLKKFNSIILFSFLMVFSLSCYKNTKKSIPSRNTDDDYVLLLEGKSKVGSPDSEIGRDEDEMEKDIFIKDFYIKSTEVTQKEWSDIMGYNPSKYPGCGVNCPVDQINWFEGIVYMNILSKLNKLDECYIIEHCNGIPEDGNFSCERVTWIKECRGYRYPTEIEWEYAARAGTNTATYNGDLTIKGKNYAPELDQIAVYAGNSGANYNGAEDCSFVHERHYFSYLCDPSPIKTKIPNSYMLYDMIGNVWEWTWDSYEKEILTEYDNEYFIKSKSNYKPVFRGCSWGFKAWTCRAANRSADLPTLRPEYIGLRPARTK